VKTPAITLHCIALGLIFWVLFPAAGAQPELVTNTEPQRVFFGEAEKIFISFHNASDQIFEGEIHARIFQTSSATAAQVGKIFWKKLQLLPGQTVLESARLSFPEVKAETKFLIQWVEGTNHIIGRTEVLVYPTNLLEELKPLAGNRTLGVFDPQNQLKPLLKNLNLDSADLENSGLTNFLGKLAIVGPFRSRSQEPDDLPTQIKTLAKKNVAVIWIQPPEKHGEIKPSFYSVPDRQTATVIVQPELVSNLPENPRSQLNLIYFCKLALNPQPLVLPDLLPP